MLRTVLAVLIGLAVFGAQWVLSAFLWNVYYAGHFPALGYLFEVYQAIGAGDPLRGERLVGLALGLLAFFLGFRWMSGSPSKDL